MISIMWNSGASWGVGTWTNYSNANYVFAVAVEGNFLWAATSGGVVKWDRTAGTYVKYSI